MVRCRIAATGESSAPPRLENDAGVDQGLDLAEEAPGAYKDVARVVDAAEQAGLATKVARLKPMICIKG